MPTYFTPESNLLQRKYHGVPFGEVDCDNLWEVLLERVDKPHEYTHIIASLLCQALDPTTSSEIEIVDGVPMIPDPVRGKTLSLARPIVAMGAYGLGVTNRYLKLVDIPTKDKQGCYLPRKATVTGMWGKSRSIAPWNAEVRKNGVQVSVTSITVSGGVGSNTNMNVDLDVGDCLQVFALGTNIEHPIVKVELAWRK